MPPKDIGQHSESYDRGSPGFESGSDCVKHQLQGIGSF